MSNDGIKLAIAQKLTLIPNLILKSFGEWESFSSHDIFQSDIIIRDVSLEFFIEELKKAIEYDISKITDIIDIKV